MPHTNELSKIAAIASGVGVAALAGAQTWPAAARDILVTAGVIVTGGLGLIATLDHFRMQRRKEWDTFNKDSLSAQLAASLQNQEHMRSSLHEIRNTANSQLVENQNLRSQLIELSDRLHKTDIDLSNTSQQLRETLRLLDESKADRESLRRELASNSGRLDKLEAPPPIIVQ